MNGKVFVSFALAASILAGCQTTGSSTAAVTPASVELPPVNARIPSVGDSAVWLMQDGNQLGSKVVSVNGNSVYVEREDGCSWSNIVGAFEPTGEWKNCESGSGSQTSKLTTGSIYPLQVGNKESWDFSGTNTSGDSWSSTRNCEVVGTASVTVPAGTFDTYRVVCEDKWWVRESYITAEGYSVKWSRTRKVGASDRNRSGELVSRSLAASS